MAWDVRWYALSKMSNLMKSLKNNNQVQENLETHLFNKSVAYDVNIQPAVSLW